MAEDTIPGSDQANVDVPTFTQADIDAAVDIAVAPLAIQFVAATLAANTERKRADGLKGELNEANLELAAAQESLVLYRDDIAKAHSDAITAANLPEGAVATTATQAAAYVAERLKDVRKELADREADLRDANAATKDAKVSIATLTTDRDKLKGDYDAAILARDRYKAQAEAKAAVTELEKLDVQQAAIDARRAVLSAKASANMPQAMERL
jgi:hypothetical protein